jgi:hypothetical protein
MLSVTNKLFMLRAIILSVTILSVTNKLFMLIAIILSVTILSVTKSYNVEYRCSECHYADCHK